MAPGDLSSLTGVIPASTLHFVVVFLSILPLDEAIASRAVFVIVSGSDGRTDGKAFGAS